MGNDLNKTLFGDITMSEDLQKINEAIRELRSEVESKAGNADKIKSLNDALDKMEEKNAEVMAKLGEAANREADLKDAINSLEAKLSRPDFGARDSDAKVRKHKAFEALAKGLQFGSGTLSEEELKSVFITGTEGRALAGDLLDAKSLAAAGMDQKTLSTLRNVDGGFLIAPEWSNEIVRNIVEISPMRPAVRNRRTASKYFEQPRRETNVRGGWVGEESLKTANNSTYDLEQIQMKKCVVFTAATIEELTQPIYDVERELLDDMVTEFARLEGEAIIVGNGTTQPGGFINDDRLETYNTGSAAEITADAIIGIQGELKVGYKPVYVLNRRTLAQVRLLKDGMGRYIWQPGLTDGNPSTINGDPYINAINMPDIGANTTPIAYGDFMRGYTLVDGVAIAVIRDVYTQATSGIVRFVWSRFMGGQVTVPEAIKLLKCAA